MQRMLRHKSSGDTYIYTHYLAQRGDMEEIPMAEQVVTEVVKPPKAAKPPKPPKVEEPVVPEFVEVQPESNIVQDGFSELLETMSNQ